MPCDFTEGAGIAKMDDPVTATAKAVEATAKAADQAFEIVHDTGGYLGRVIADGGGLPRGCDRARPSC